MTATDKAAFIVCTAHLLFFALALIATLEVRLRRIRELTAYTPLVSEMRLLQHVAVPSARAMAAALRPALEAASKAMADFTRTFAEVAAIVESSQGP